MKKSGKKKFKLNIGKKVKKVLNHKIGKHCLKWYLSIIVFILIILFLIKLLGGLFMKNKIPNYSLVYLNENGQISVVKSNGKKPTVLSDKDNVDVAYPNNTDRYVLYTKENNLYLYDSKHTKNLKLLAQNVTNEFGYNSNDKYIYYINSNRELYSYKRKSIKLDNDVNIIYLVSDDKIFYSKINSDAVYYQKLNGRKERVEIANNINKIYIDKKGKNIIYLDNFGGLFKYKVGNKKAKKIGSNIIKIVDVNEDLTKAYYINNNYDLYYLKDNKGKKVSKEVNTIYYSDLDNKQIIYDSKGKLYYQKGSSKAVNIDESSNIRNVYIYNKSNIYYIKKDDTNYNLYFARITNFKVKKSKQILKNVQPDAITDYKKGFVILNEVLATGILNVIKKDKIYNIAKEVNANSVKVNSNGKKLYFISDYSNNKGIFQYTKNTKPKKILSDVSGYTFVNDKLIYVMGGYSNNTSKFDIYKFNGKKAKKIISNILDIVNINIDRGN